MKIKILSHCHGFTETEIPDDFEFLRVTLMTGDEIIEIYKEDIGWGDPYLYKTLDPELNNRTRNFLDCTYIVFPDQIEKWNNRRDSYDRWQREEFEKTFSGHFGISFGV